MIKYMCKSIKLELELIDYVIICIFPWNVGEVSAESLTWFCSVWSLSSKNVYTFSCLCLDVPDMTDRADRCTDGHGERTEQQALTERYCTLNGSERFSYCSSEFVQITGDVCTITQDLTGTQSYISFTAAEQDRTRQEISEISRLS